MRRAGRVLTGVDRVELAYLRAVIADDIPAYGLIRSRIGYILVAKTGLTRLEPMFSERMGPAEVWATARRGAIARVPPVLLGWALRKLPPGFAYLNTGHSNLTARVLGTIRAQPGARIAVFVHDIIPLEHPQYQRPDTVEPFAQMMDRVAQTADLVICNSEDTRGKLVARMNRDVPMIVAHLGTDLATPKPDQVPADLPHRRPYFVNVGTIEPRKNHALLLDLWQDMGPDAPGLIIAGSRGWANAPVFARLDALGPMGPVREVSGLCDGALVALMQQSAGVLFPSFVEGYGLPVVEAAACQVPVIANDLPVYREFVRDIPIYASVSDRYLWMNKIKELAEAGPDAPQPKQFDPPTWDAHFKTVLRLT